MSEKKLILAYRYLADGLTIREQSSSAYALLEEILLERYGLSPSDFEYRRLELGKPYVVPTDVGREVPHFNLTHTDGLCAVAVGDVEVGVDAEWRREISERLRRRWLGDCKPEVALVEWTRRESYGKLTGEGFAHAVDKSPHVFRTLELEGHIVTLCVAESERRTLEDCEVLVK